jgi:hypothetical protein
LLDQAIWANVFTYDEGHRSLLPTTSALKTTTEPQSAQSSTINLCALWTSVVK